jgi:hypothetical protein
MDLQRSLCPGKQDGTSELQCNLRRGYPIYCGCECRWPQCFSDRDMRLPYDGERRASADLGRVQTGRGSFRGRAPFGDGRNFP